MNYTRIIKKYKNRKFYDLEMSRYVNLKEINHLIVSGINLKIIDYNLNDITIKTAICSISKNSLENNKNTLEIIRNLSRL